MLRIGLHKHTFDIFGKKKVFFKIYTKVKIFLENRVMCKWALTLPLTQITWAEELQKGENVARWNLSKVDSRFKIQNLNWNIVCSFVIKH